MGLEDIDQKIWVEFSTGCPTWLRCSQSFFGDRKTRSPKLGWSLVQAVGCKQVTHHFEAFQPR
jgi:hypothetical protein